MSAGGEAELKGFLFLVGAARCVLVLSAVAKGDAHAGEPVLLNGDSDEKKDVMFDASPAASPELFRYCDTTLAPLYACSTPKPASLLRCSKAASGPSALFLDALPLVVGETAVSELPGRSCPVVDPCSLLGGRDVLIVAPVSAGLLQGAADRGKDLIC